MIFLRLRLAFADLLSFNPIYTFYTLYTQTTLLHYKRTTDNRLRTTVGAAAGVTESRNYGNWLRFATPDNGQRRAKPAHCSRLKAHSLSVLSIPSILSLPKNITTLLHYIFRTTDYRLRTTDKGFLASLCYAKTTSQRDN